MSAHGGLCFWDRRVVPPMLIHVIDNSLRFQGPDSRGNVCVGWASLLFRGLHITPESVSEQQPAVSGECYLTWDGRLDNRDDLLMQLSGAASSQSGDSEIVIASWLQWNQDCLPRLLGEWALAVWDKREQRLCLARDYSGACPLFYTVTKAGVCWSSELATFTASAIQEEFGALRLDEGWIAGYLARGAELDATPYCGVRAVPPGCVVSIREGKVSTSRYWSFDPDNQIRYKSDCEYEEAFRHLLQAAVRSRLRSHRPVWAQLSGGLDSSSVLCIADAICAREQHSLPAPRVEAVSAVYPGSPASDEREFIECIEAQRGYRGHYFTDIDYMLASPAPYETWPASPHYFDCFAIRERAICDAMARSGARVQLCGDGGDELLGNAGDGLPNQQDALYTREWATLWRELREWSAILRKSQLHSFGDLVSTLLPKRVQLQIDKNSKLLLSLVAQPFVRTQDIRLRYMGAPDPYGYSLPSQRGRSEALMTVIRRVSETPFRRVGAVHVTYPYLDRRLVAFLLSIPMDQLTRPGERRSLMRRALLPIVPRKVLTRRSKRSPDTALYQAMLRQWPSVSPLLADPLVCSLGFIDRHALQSAAERVRHGTFPVTLFAKALMLELWLQHSHIVTTPVSTSCALREYSHLNSAVQV